MTTFEKPLTTEELQDLRVKLHNLAKIDWESVVNLLEKGLDHSDPSDPNIRKILRLVEAMSSHDTLSEKTTPKETAEINASGMGSRRFQSWVNRVWADGGP